MMADFRALEERLQACDPEVLDTVFPASGFDTDAAHVQTFGELRQAFGDKYAFVDAMMQMHFTQRCCQGSSLASLTAPLQNKHRDAERTKKAKEHKQLLKSDIASISETHAMLYTDISAAVPKAKESRDKANRSLWDVRSRAEAEELAAEAAESREVRPSLASTQNFEAALKNAQDAAHGGTERFASTQAPLAEAHAKRQRLEVEIREAEQRLKMLREETVSVEADVKKHREKNAKFERRLIVGQEVGLPRLAFDLERCVVEVGRGAGELGKVHYELKEGVLVRAEPHKSLGLAREAAEAVEEDDLPMLLAQVWSELQEQGLGDSDPVNLRRAGA